MAHTDLEIHLAPYSLSVTSSTLPTYCPIEKSEKENTEIVSNEEHYTRLGLI